MENYFKSTKENQMMRAYLRKRVHAALDERLERFEALETPEQIAAYQERLKTFFRETIDLDSFERGPLKARVTGKLERDGYSVEKVIFESLPGFSVTANLYLPGGEGPFPGILHPCGHSSNGKAYEAYQRANILLARNGFAVLCYDPIGQGERLQLIDPKTGKKLPGNSSEHLVLGVAPVLLGRSLASYMIWDGMRAIDYLQSRPEIDPDRIGCTGNSGGGNMTSFLMTLDDRIQAAAPGCFTTTTRRKNESPGPGDPEQNLFAQTREGLDHPDFTIMRAPKPTLILAATYDYVPIEGAWDAFRQSKRIYTKLGYPERVDLIEAPEKHGFTRRMREGVVRFFSRWLKGENVEVFEPESVRVEKDAELQCTSKGQVLRMEGERSLFEVNRERANALKAARTEAWAGLNREERREAVREVLGIEPEALPSRMELGGFGSTIASGGGSSEFRELLFEPESGIRLPAFLSRGKAHSEVWARNAPVDLFCFDGRWNFGDVSGLPIFEDYERASSAETIGINLRDSGFSKTKNWRFYGADAWIAHMLGDSYLAMRTRDLISVTKWLKSSPRIESDMQFTGIEVDEPRTKEEEGNINRPIHLHAEDEFVPVALHAAALEPELFESVTLHGGILSWEEVIDSREPIPQWHNVVHGALRHYDLPDLIELIGEGRVTWK
ncbi:MAG: acetylxylan esterase [Verrucomicrobiae bacterium]|nr:acetylxylan esterase [Verrucomicrobiae bacterium]